MTNPLLGAMALLLLLPMSTVSQEAVGSEHVHIEEWEVPWEQSRPRDPYVGPDGRVWFVGQRSHYAAFLDPASGEFKRYDLDEGTGPHNLVVDSDGTVWYAGNLARHIGSLDPATGAIEKFMMPDERARDPHTLVLGEQGDLWFTVQGGNFVGRFWKETGKVELVQAPEVEGGRSRSSRPYGIVTDSRDRPWIALFNANLIATVDPASMELSTFELPDGARPRRLVVSSDDRIWYVDYQRGMLARLDPGSGQIREWASPGGAESRPYGMVVDGEDRIWFVETGIQPNRFIGFDPDSEEFFSVTEVGSGGGTIRHMFFHSDTNSVWFGTDVNTIGRASITPKAGRPAS